MARLLSLVLCFFVASWAEPVLARDVSSASPLGPRPWLGDPASGANRLAQAEGEPAADAEAGAALPASDVEARIAELEARRNAIDIQRPRFWTITGGVMTSVGAVIAIVSIVGCLGSSTAGAGCSPEHWAGLGTTAALFTIGGIATLVPNEKKLRERSHERRSLELEIRELRERQEAAAHRSGLRLGFDPRSKAVTVGWVY